VTGFREHGEDSGFIKGEKYFLTRCTLIILLRRTPLRGVSFLASGLQTGASEVMHILYVYPEFPFRF
jgi:hypothetical protein